MNDRPAISVILPVYNVAEYLPACLDSILGQTFGNFELVCIDDGSTDSSGLILDGYAKKDSRMSVTHRANGGLSSARNEGLASARGEYLYMCDSDDICETEILERLYGCARRYEADVVCCEMSSFDCVSGESLGRFTFPSWVWGLPMPFSGKDVARELFSLFGSSTCDKLFSRRLVEEKGIRFDEGVRRFTSFRFTALALAFAGRIALLPESLYRYRENRPGSQQATREKSPSDAFKTRVSVMRCLDEQGVFDDYALGFLVSTIRIARSQLRGTRLPENRRRCYDGLMDLGSEIVSRAGFPHMDFAHTPEYGYWQEWLATNGPGEYSSAEGKRTFDMSCPFAIDIRERYRRLKGAIRRSRGRAVPQVSGSLRGFRLKLDFLRVDKGGVTFEGCFFCDRADPEGVFDSLSLVRETRETRMAVRLADRAWALDSTSEYGEKVKAWRFACQFPASGTEVAAFRWQSKGDRVLVPWHRVEHTRYSPFTNLLRHSYAVVGGSLFSFAGDRLVARPATVLRRTAAEIFLALNLLKKRSKVAIKALVLRWCVRLMRTCRRRPQWLFSDRFNVADDNGRALYEYVRSLPAKEEPPRAVLALSADSPQFEELSAKGCVVNADSFRYKLEFLLSDCILSAYHTRRHRLPFDDGFVEYAKDLVLHPKFIQLRHGVCQNDTSATQNKWFDNPSVLLAVSERERQSMIAPAYGFDPDTVRTTGFPRFDLLYDDPKKLITFMPTWRQDLIEWSEDGHHRAAPSASENPFIVRYRDVLADGDFISRCERSGYKVCLKGHPNLSSVLHLLKLDPRVKVCGNDIPYRQMFAETSLLVTDYSSTAFDFAYLHKPVVYFQFDGEKFFRETYRRGYFDCVRDGFGPVCGTAEELKRTVLRMIAEGCRMDPVYDGRVSSFFAHDDSGNCKRVYDAVWNSSATV